MNDIVITYPKIEPAQPSPRIDIVEYGRKFCIIDVVSIEIMEAFQLFVGDARLEIDEYGTNFIEAGNSSPAFRATIYRRVSADEACTITVHFESGLIARADSETIYRKAVARAALDSFEEGILKGWIVTHNLLVEDQESLPRLTLSGIDLGVIAPTDDRGDVKAAGWSDHQLIGFNLDVSEMLYLHSSSQQHMSDTYDFCVYHSDECISAREFRVEISCHGRLESVKGGVIRGWAVRSPFQQCPCEVSIEIDGIKYANVKCDRNRSDLNRAGITNRGGGFVAEIPTDLTFPSLNPTVEVYILPERIMVSHSPMKMETIAGEGSGSKSKKQFLGRGDKHVSIIIPIYNAFEELKRCLTSVAKHTSGHNRLILIDDNSSDGRISKFLEEYASADHVQVTFHSSNQGFTKTANEGLKIAVEDDVILLNSDTIVTPRWLENLQTAAYSRAKIATVTPLSDNAGVFSVPVAGQGNLRPPMLDSETYARCVTQSSGVTWPEVPTGNGFCLYIRNEAIKELGILDEIAFPIGYGEENDFCMRALRRGYLNIIDDRTIIYHKRSASFGSSKSLNYSNGQSILRDRYPEYSKLTPIFRSGADFNAIRYRVAGIESNKVASPRLGLPRILYVISTVTGGTPQTNLDLMTGLQRNFDTWLLRCDTKTIFLSRLDTEGLRSVKQIAIGRPVNISTHCSTEYDDIIKSLLVDFAIEIVHIRHIGWHSLELPSICRELSIPVIFSFHDFYTICPTVKLLDEKGDYCGGTCTSGAGECSVELWDKGSVPPLKHRWIKQWQVRMGAMLETCDSFVTTSDQAKEQILTIFPNIHTKAFTVIEHGRDFNRFIYEDISPSEDNVLRILIPGNIDVAKGADIIMALHEMDVSGLLEFHILGTAPKALTGKRIIKHGGYKREEFSEKAALIKPHVGAVLSIWPETYCHTLTELWSVGLPAVAFDIGAVAERIRATNGGWLVNLNCIPDLFDLLVSLFFQEENYRSKRSNVRIWQGSQGRKNTVKEMASKYCTIYNDAIADRRSFKDLALKHRDRNQILVVTPGNPDKGIAPGSTHVRVWERTRGRPVRSLNVYSHCRPVAALSYISNNRVDALLIQRNAIPLGLVVPLIDECRRKRIPIMIELDDDILFVPEHIDKDSSYKRYRIELLRLLAAAKLVVVSTPDLREKYMNYCSNTVIVENRISERLWGVHKVASDDARRTRDGQSKAEIVYMGSSSHAHDFASVRKAFDELYSGGYDFVVSLIGMQADPAPWLQPVEIPDAAKNYPHFVQWFRGEAAGFDFAIAPLLENDFNKYKSGLKFQEYAAAGLSGIFSDTVFYRELVHRSGAGLLCGSDVDSWLVSLKDAISNLEKMRNMGSMARQWVLNELVLENALEPFDELISSNLDNIRVSTGTESEPRLATDERSVACRDQT